MTTRRSRDRWITVYQCSMTVLDYVSPMRWPILIAHRRRMAYLRHYPAVRDNPFGRVVAHLFGLCTDCFDAVSMWITGPAKPR